MEEDEKQKPKVPTADELVERFTQIETLKTLRAIRSNIDQTASDVFEAMHRYSESPLARAIGLLDGQISPASSYMSSLVKNMPSIGGAAYFDTLPVVMALGGKHDALANVFRDLEKQDLILSSLTASSKLSDVTAVFGTSREIANLALQLSKANVGSVLSQYEQSARLRGVGLHSALDRFPASLMSEPSRGSGRLFESLRDLAPEVAQDLADATERLIEKAPEREQGEPSAKQIVLATTSRLNVVIETLAHYPEERYGLDDRVFEELVAELFARQGFEAHLTPRSNDLGRDVIVIAEDVLSRRVVSVQCKRHAKGHTVGRPILQQIMGVVAGTNGSSSLVVTTSTFTRPARDWAASTSGLVKLQDGEAFIAMLRNVRSRIGTS